MERARAARRDLDRHRETRDGAVQTAAAGCFTAEESRAAVLEQIRTIEVQMAQAILSLRDLKEPVARIAVLLRLDTREVRRLITAEGHRRAAEHGDAKAKSVAALEGMTLRQC